MTFDSWLKSRREYFKDKYYEEAHKNGVQKEQALEQALNKSEHTTNMLQNKLKVVSDNIDVVTADVNKY